jgi:predicted transcriptional regulator
MKRIFFKIAKSLLAWSFNYVYNYIDSDDDGKIDEKELKQFINNLKTLIKNKNKK